MAEAGLHEDEKVLKCFPCKSDRLGDVAPTSFSHDVGYRDERFTRFESMVFLFVDVLMN
jgi:hypothetical protein